MVAMATDPKAPIPSASESAQTEFQAPRMKTFSSPIDGENRVAVDNSRKRGQWV
jgi:hypothetical protein